jgi:hypothetical protein
MSYDDVESIEKLCKLNYEIAGEKLNLILEVKSMFMPKIVLYYIRAWPPS